jgi:hypothetical protein
MCRAYRIQATNGLLGNHEIPLCGEKAQPSNDGAFQKWYLLDGDDESYWSIVNVATGFALDGNMERDIYTMTRNTG